MSLSPDEVDALHTQLASLTFEARIEKNAEAEREIEDLCRRYPFLALERAQMVKQRRKAQVVLARRARRGKPLVPVRVVKANGRVRRFGPKLPSGRAPRRACNLHVRGSARSRAGSRSPPSGDDDPGGDGDEGDDHHLAGGRR